MGWLRLPDWLTQPWHTSAVNPWGFEMEQRTLDGDRYRHRTFDDKLNPLPWIDGPHPIAQRLRDQGKDETDGFRR